MNSYLPHKWILLTLTTPSNCKREDLKESINLLHKNFMRLTRRKFWMESVEGFIRSTEVLQTCELLNPHIHLLLAVNESFSYNKIFHRKEDCQGNTFFKLGSIWGKYYKRKYVQVDIKRIDPSRSKTTEERKTMPWLGDHQITPNDLSNTVLNYILKPDQKDPSIQIESQATRQTSSLVDQLRNTRLVSTGGTLSGYLQSPPKPRLTEEEKDKLNDRFKSENIKSRFEFDTSKKRYKSVEMFTFSGIAFTRLKNQYQQFFRKSYCNGSSERLNEIDYCYSPPKDPIKGQKYQRDFKHLDKK